MLAAAISWGFGTVLFKRVQWSAPISSVVGWQLLLAGVPIGSGAIALEPMPDVWALSELTWLAMSYVLLLPMVFGQWAFFKIVSLFSATIAAIGTMCVPVIGVVSSALVIGEPVGVQDILALVLICTALACVLLLPALDR